MKRDMNLIRSLLLLYEGEEPKPDLSEWTEDQQVYHSALLVEAKLVDGSILPDHTGYPRGTAVLRLTWDGHEFLDAARNESAWKSIRKKAVTAGVSLTFPVLKTLLTHYIKEKLGIRDSDA
ncbi:MAG TPA: DUF2513 domain-containing protein [Chthoniobacterales bacterium]|nr:DUF2513 domain-containing protein [Chthoniobacterales bacterium]